MNTVQKIAKNLVALSIAQLANLALGFVLSIYIARSLGDINFGKYSFALAFTSLFAVFSDMGYNTLLVREVAKDKSQASDYLDNVLSFRLLLSGLIFSFMILSINLLSYPTDTKNTIYLFGACALIDSLATIFIMIFRAFERMELEAKIAIIANIAKTSGGLLVLYLGYGLLGLALVFLLSSSLHFIMLTTICKKNFANPKLKFNLQFLKRTLIIALPLSMTGISLLIFTRTDTLMLSSMKGDAVVGWYNAAYNLVLSFKPIPHLFMNALFPAMAGYAISSKNTFKVISEISSRYLICLGLPLAVGISLLADKIVLFLYGPLYSDSIIALRILSFDIVIFFIWINCAFILISINKQNLWAITAIATVFLNIILNILLIPTLSYIGASIATIISEAICVTFLIFYIYKELSIFISYYNALFKPMLATSVMASFICSFNQLNLFIIIIVSMIIYFLSLYIIGGVSKEDISLIHRIIKK